MNMRPCLFLLALSIAAALHAQVEPERIPLELQKLLERIPSVADGNGHSVGRPEKNLAKEIQAFGRLAVAPMITLLEDKNDHIRFFAGYVLRDLPGLEERHLDALIRAHQRGDGWIPPAIGRVGTPRAIAYLIGDLQRRPESHTQVTWALTKAKGAAAIALAQLFHAQAVVDRQLCAAVCQILNEQGKDAAPAVPILLAAIQDRSAVRENRRAALRALASIGVEASDTVPALKKLARAEPEFAEAVDSAIAGIGSPDAAEVFAARLRSSPDQLLLRDLAEIGHNGKAAGAEVTKLLTHENWELRVNAARALGYIGYTEATDDLRQLLSNEDDWRLVYVAAESLGRLKAKAAVPELQKVAQAHGFKPVRTAAAKAIEVIRGRATYESRWARANFPFEFFEYVNAGTDAYPDTGPVRGKPLVLGPDELSAKALLEDEPAIEVPSEDTGEKLRMKPTCGLKLKEGVLLGSNRGEWGGELVLKKTNGQTQVLLHENVRGVHQTPSGIFATVGLAHLFFNDGSIYRIEFDAAGDGRAVRWKILPGAPEKSGFSETGELVVYCNGGAARVTQDGKFEFLDL